MLHWGKKREQIIKRVTNQDNKGIELNTNTLLTFFFKGKILFSPIYCEVKKKYKALYFYNLLFMPYSVKSLTTFCQFCHRKLLDSVKLNANLQIHVLLKAERGSLVQSDQVIYCAGNVVQSGWPAWPHLLEPCRPSSKYFDVFKIKIAWLSLAVPQTEG